MVCLVEEEPYERVMELLDDLEVGYEEWVSEVYGKEGKVAERQYGLLIAEEGNGVEVTVEGASAEFVFDEKFNFLHIGLC